MSEPSPSLTFFRLAREQYLLHPSQVATAAIWSCALCTNVISGMGGPGHGTLCFQCGEDLLAGRLRGAVKRGAGPGAEVSDG